MLTYNKCIQQEIKSVKCKKKKILFSKWLSHTEVQDLSRKFLEADIVLEA